MKTRNLFTGIAALTFIGQSEIHAQASTWTGTGTSVTPAPWSVGSNWSANAPTSGATISLLFNNTAANSFSNNDLTGLTVSSISIPATFNAVNVKDNTITGNSVTLGGTVTIDTGNYQNFGFGMDLGAVRTFAVNSGQLTLSGNLTGASGGISKSGGGALVISGDNSLGAATRLSITSGSTVYIDSTTALGVAGGNISFSNSVAAALSIRSNTAINSYNLTGGSSSTGGTVTLGRQSSGAAYTQSFGILEVGSRAMTFNQGSNISSGIMVASFSEMRLTAGNNDRVVALNGTAAISLGNVATTANANNNRRLGLSGTNANNAVTGVISNLAPSVTGTSVLSLIKSDASTWTLTGANTYTGITSIAGGTLQLGNGGGTGSLNSASAIQNGGTFAINRSGTVTQGTDFAGTIGAYTTDYSTNSAGVALGSPVLGKLVKSGSGNLILNGSNALAAADSLTFSGGGSGTVTLTNTSALGAAGNSVRFSGGGSGILDLQTDSSVNAYNIASGTLNGGTIIANRATSGSISHALGVLDLSSVTLTVNKGSNVTGTAAASFTELKMTGGNDNSPVTLAGSADVSISSASITSTGISKRLQLDGTSQSNTIGAISDTNNATTGAKINLIKANSSTWTLTAANTYTGDTTVKAGTLALGAAGSIDNSLKIIVGDTGSSGAVLDVSARTGGFTIGGAQTLGGIGTVDANAGGTLRNVTIEGRHAPGNSVGIQTVDGNLSYASTSIFEWELTANTTTQGASPNPTFDQVAVANGGTLAIDPDAKFRIILNSSGSAVDFTDTFWSADRSWSIFTGASALTGFTLDSVSADKNGVAFAANHPNGSFSVTGSTLTWTAVPESSSALVGLLVGAGLLRRRRDA